MCSQPPIAVQARRHARAKAHGFTLLEILIVLLLLLALAGLVIPAASAWLGNVQSDQVRQQVVELIKDQLIESMRSRQPRAIWVASRPLNGAAPVLPEPPADPSASGPGDSARPAAPTVRWVLGCRPLSSAAERTGTSGSELDDGKQLPSLVDLPRGWLLSVAVAAPSDDDEAAAEPGGTTAIADAAQAAPASSPDPATQTASLLDSGELSQMLILWPSGQIDVLIPMELTEPDGRRWKLDINPWTLAVTWTLAFNPADDAASGSAQKRSEPRDAAADTKPVEPVKPAESDNTLEPPASDATPTPSPANKPLPEPKDAKERNQRDGTKPSKPDDDQKRSGAAMRT